MGDLGKSLPARCDQGLESREAWWLAVNLVATQEPIVRIKQQRKGLVEPVASQQSFLGSCSVCSHAAPSRQRVHVFDRSDGVRRCGTRTSSDSVH